MDLELLESLGTIAWPEISACADLGCGSGRTGSWLARRGVRRLDGVDLTPEMLELARRREVYATLTQADVEATGLDSRAYELVVCCLVDEHLRELEPLYGEAARLLAPGGSFVIVGYHPQFVMVAGVPTHFDRSSGEPLAIETHVHPLSDQVAAGLGAGLRLAEMGERLIDERWCELKPRWEPYRGHPISFVMAWATG